MKKFFPFILLTALLALSNCSMMRFNCNPIGGNFIYGPQLGYDVSNFQGEQVHDSQYIGSLSAGLFMAWMFNEEIRAMRLRSGLMYNQFGSRHEFNAGPSQYKSSDRLSYLSLPFAFEYMFARSFGFELGPDFSYMVSARQRVKFDNQTYSNNTSDYYKNFILGFHIAMYYLHATTGGQFFMGYNRGLTPLNQDDYGSKAYNSGFSLGVKYPLNKFFYRNPM
jgi:outer membrane immunogenic protein